MIGERVSIGDSQLTLWTAGGEVIGFLIHDISSLKQPAPVEFELESEVPDDDVANVTVREAAARLGVSERRVRQLACDGRIRGVTKAGSEWLIPTQVELIPCRRGPVGIAGHADSEFDKFLR